MLCAEISILALVFYLNIREPLIVAKPFNDQGTDYVLKCLASESIELGPQKFECWTDGRSICGQVPMFINNKLRCRKCCKKKNVASKNDKIKIKVGESHTNSAKKGKETEGKVRKDGLVPEGWKYSSIILIVFVTIGISALTGVIFKMKKNINHVPQQESHPPSTEDQTGNNETDRLNQNRSNGIQLEQFAMPSS